VNDMSFGKVSWSTFVQLNAIGIWKPSRFFHFVFQRIACSFALSVLDMTESHLRVVEPVLFKWVLTPFGSPHMRSVLIDAWRCFLSSTTPNVASSHVQLILQAVCSLYDPPNLAHI
jgi:hypothetical protein